VDIRTLPTLENRGGSDEPLLAPDSGDLVKPTESLRAVAVGFWVGLKIAGEVVASVLCVLAHLGLVQRPPGLVKQLSFTLSVQMIDGYVFYPVAFLLGVSRSGNDLVLVAMLIDIKVVANEVVAVCHPNIRMETGSFKLMTKLVRWGSATSWSQSCHLLAVMGKGQRRTSQAQDS
jgi:nucleoside permease NupC